MASGKSYLNMDLAVRFCRAKFKPAKQLFWQHIISLFVFWTSSYYIVSGQNLAVIICPDTIWQLYSIWIQYGSAISRPGHNIAAKFCPDRMWQVWTKYSSHIDSIILSIQNVVAIFVHGAYAPHILLLKIHVCMFILVHFFHILAMKLMFGL